MNKQYKIAIVEDIAKTITKLPADKLWELVEILKKYESGVVDNTDETNFVVNFAYSAIRQRIKAEDGKSALIKGAIPRIQQEVYFDINKYGDTYVNESLTIKMFIKQLSTIQPNLMNKKQKESK